MSNISLILGVAGAEVAPGVVRLAGLSGLMAGAVSMAAGEYISVKAQNELIERELAVERKALEDDPAEETEELAQLYISRGLRPDTAQEVAEQLMANPTVALEVHAREELGVDPEDLGDPTGAALSSFAAFCVGAIVPLLPWFFSHGQTAVVVSVILGLVAAAFVGALLAQFTGRSLFFSAVRQTLIAAGAASVTYLIGSQVGTGL